jgi:Kef-type K+ transport system membrane component KefB
VTFTDLALIGFIGLIGAVLAIPERVRLPVVIGELAAGVLFGRSGLEWLTSSDPTFSFLADIGFALVMFVAGTHVPLRNDKLREALTVGLLRAALVGVVSVGLAVLISHAFGSGHTALFAVLLSSSSAALVLPIIDSLGLTGQRVLRLTAQVAVADTACIVALPIAIDPTHAGRAALGAAAVTGSAIVLFMILWFGRGRNLRAPILRLSKERSLALELRINLAILFALAALARYTHVSVMLAGFSFGLAVAAIGPPRRLARQLFALTEGFFGPLFFIWLGASLDLGSLSSHPASIGLGVCLGLAAILTHLVPRVLGQPLSLGLLAAAQLGVPVAATTIGTQLGVLSPADCAALILGALVTVLGSAVGGALAARHWSAAATPAPVPTQAPVQATESPSRGGPPAVDLSRD